MHGTYTLDEVADALGVPLRSAFAILSGEVVVAEVLAEDERGPVTLPRQPVPDRVPSLLLMAARGWIEQHGNPFTDGHYATSENRFLYAAESAWFDATPPPPDLRPAASDTPRKKQPIPAELRWAVWERDDFTCQDCGTRRRLSIDHVHPESLGGTLDPDNLQTLCVPCNSRKGTRLVAR